MINKALLPDITSQASTEYATRLQWVGMEAIAVPLKVLVSHDEIMSVAASADVLVSLDQQGAKGIHMSRLYLKLNEILAHQTLSQQSLSQLLDTMINSQQGISQSAMVRLRFDLNLKRKALKSGKVGYQSYPVKLSTKLVDNKVFTELDLTIPYSSTCPCSAALSRQLLSETIDTRFSGNSIDKSALLEWVASEEGSVATPHSQRSYAYIKLKFSDGYFPDISNLIASFEDAIGTPVQTAVKREDEQAFAKLNAENLMFCEDAARKIKRMLEEEMSFVEGYWYKVEHQESLHAHNAVVIDAKNFD